MDNPWPNATGLPVAHTAREPFPAIIYLILTPVALACFVAFNFRPFWRLSAFVAYIGWTLAGTRYSAGSPIDNYFTGLLLGLGCFLALIELVLADPVTEWQHESEPGPLYEKPFWKRVWWLLSLTCSIRNIGWTSQVPFVPATEPVRWKYTLRKIRQIFINWLIIDMIQVHTSADPAFSADPRSVPIASQPYIRRFLAAMMSGAISSRVVDLQYNILALVVVGLGIQEPRSWPDLFGNWSEAYTIRKFWSRVWHQLARRFSGPSGKAAARALHLTPGSWLSARVQLIVGFAASGACHVVSDYMVGPSWVGNSMPFFLWQAVGITIEDFVIKVGSALGIKLSWWTRLLGYLWVWSIWFTFTVPLFTEWMVAADVIPKNPISFSIVRPVLDYIHISYGVNVLDYLVPELRYVQY